MHELGPVFELGPLVVSRLQRHGHIHRLLHRHPPAFSDSWHATLSAAAVAADARKQAAGGLLDQATGSAGLVDLARDGFLEVLADLVTCF
jgi:hypothetical protein